MAYRDLKKFRNQRKKNLISAFGGKESAKIELDKCELLCALCHRLEHSSYKELPNLINFYSGKLFK